MIFYDFSRKMFFMLYSPYRPDFLVGLPLLLKILGNMHTVIVCFKCRRNKMSFYDEIESIFHHFKGLSLTKNCLGSENAPLSNQGFRRF